MSGYTRIVDMNPKVCAEVCTMYAKETGCQAEGTAYLRDEPKDKCPVGKKRAEQWYRRNEARKNK